MYISIVRVPADCVAHEELAHVARHLQLRRRRGEGMPGRVIEAQSLARHVPPHLPRSLRRSAGSEELPEAWSGC